MKLLRLEDQRMVGWRGLISEGFSIPSRPAARRALAGSRASRRTAPSIAPTSFAQWTTTFLNDIMPLHYQNRCAILLSRFRAPAHSHGKN